MATSINIAETIDSFGTAPGMTRMTEGEKHHLEVALEHLLCAANSTSKETRCTRYKLACEALQKSLRGL